ncbi:hypothetical protein EIP86_000214 [Pleurotus ostreatoroseus]|nr:hypothetical protein EIP86_000214 [Pleurotus ostreatoroseus]
MFPLVALAVLLGLVSALPSPSPASDAALPPGFENPVNGGGSWLDDAGNGLGEPMNVVISSLSNSKVLSLDGLLNFARAINFSTECLGIHLGAPQAANLGDGNGPVNQTIEIRQDFGNAALGTCEETLVGGNHFRIFGPQANSGAFFLAVSMEEDLAEQHTIATDGYNTGRDALVALATTGTPSFGDVTYSVTSQLLPGVMVDGSTGVNHGASARLVSLLK